MGEIMKVSPSYRKYVIHNIYAIITYNTIALWPILYYTMGLRLNVFETIIFTFGLVFAQFLFQTSVFTTEIKKISLVGYRSKLIYNDEEIPLIFANLDSHSFVSINKKIPNQIIVLSSNDILLSIFHELGHYFHKDPVKTVIIMMATTIITTITTYIFHKPIHALILYVLLSFAVLYLKHRSEIRADKFMLNFIDCESYRKFIENVTGVPYEFIETPKTKKELLKHKIISILLGHLTYEYRFRIYEECKRNELNSLNEGDEYYYGNQNEKPLSNKYYNDISIEFNNSETLN